MNPIEKKLNSKIKNKKRSEKMSEVKIKESVQIFSTKLREAIVEDQISAKNKKPAFHKLKLLPIIESFLSNYKFQREFLKEEGQDAGCGILQEWLKKNADGTYPPINQLTKMIDILYNLKLEIENLKDSQIGKYIMDISKNFKINKGVMKKAKELVEKWSRQIYGINSDYREYLHENEIIYEKNLNRKREKSSNLECELKIGEGREKKPVFEEIEADNSKKDTNIFTHARIPKKGLFDFNKRPIPSVSEDSSRISNNYKNVNYTKIFQKKREIGATKKKYEYD